MTEQPQQPGQVEEEGQPTGTASGYAPEQEVAPAPEAPWRFFVRVQDNPDAENYLQPQSLHRLQETETDLFTHRFERETRTWIHNPEMIAFSGMGGADDYQEIDEGKANALIAQWREAQGEESLETEEVPEAEESASDRQKKIIEEDEDEEQPLPIP